MCNIITLFVHFHRPTFFEPLTRAHPQGYIIQNRTLVTPTGTIIYMSSLQLFRYTI
jgi:hypothetical protein